MFELWFLGFGSVKPKPTRHFDLARILDTQTTLSLVGSTSSPIGLIIMVLVIHKPSLTSSLWNKSHQIAQCVIPWSESDDLWLLAYSNNMDMVWKDIFGFFLRQALGAVWTGDFLSTYCRRLGKWELLKLSHLHVLYISTCFTSPRTIEWNLCLSHLVQASVWSYMGTAEEDLHRSHFYFAKAHQERADDGRDKCRL